ncbi:MAG TPA: hypothetical protein VF727_03805 [Allosphingosinicella sp.]
MTKPDFSRRTFLGAVAGAATAGTFSGCARAAAGQTFTPEQFGARGDGRSDDYDAFARLVKAVNAAGGGTVLLGAGRTYRIGRFVAPGNGVVDLAFDGCDPLVVEGNGAKISVEGRFARTSPKIRGLAGLHIENSRNVTVRNLELDGNVGDTTRTPKLVESGVMCGLSLRSCFDVRVENIFAHHFAADGLVIRESAARDAARRRRVCRNVTVVKSRFLYNARQGTTITSLRGGLFEDCEFSYSGFVDSKGTMSRYGAHSPASGVDVEPDNSPTENDRLDVLTGDITFRRCRMVGSYGPAFLASKFQRGHYWMENVRLENCQIECHDGETGGTDGFIFDVPGGQVVGCTLQMRDKTAYLCWNKLGNASPRFASNTVYGRNPAAHRYIFALRANGGSPVVEGNRFIAQHRSPKPRGGGSWLIFLDNANATVRSNEMVLPKEAHHRAGALPAVYANVARMDRNTYRTDLPAGGGAHFEVVYESATAAVGEKFNGGAASPTGAVRPLSRPRKG